MKKASLLSIPLLCTLCCALQAAQPSQTTLTQNVERKVAAQTFKDSALRYNWARLIKKHQGNADAVIEEIIGERLPFQAGSNAISYVNGVYVKSGQPDKLYVDLRNIILARNWNVRDEIEFNSFFYHYFLLVDEEGNFQVIHESEDENGEARSTPFIKPDEFVIAWKASPQAHEKYLNAVRVKCTQYWLRHWAHDMKLAPTELLTSFLAENPEETIESIIGEKLPFQIGSNTTTYVRGVYQFDGEKDLYVDLATISLWRDLNKNLQSSTQHRLLRVNRPAGTYDVLTPESDQDSYRNYFMRWLNTRATEKNTKLVTLWETNEEHDLQFINLAHEKELKYLQSHAR